MASNNKSLTSISPAFGGEQNFVDLHRRNVNKTATSRNQANNGVNGVNNAQDKVKTFDRAKNRYGYDMQTSIDKYDSREAIFPPVKQKYGSELATSLGTNVGDDVSENEVHKVVIGGEQVGIFHGDRKDAPKYVHRILKRHGKVKVEGTLYNIDETLAAIKEDHEPDNDTDDELSFHKSLRAFADKQRKTQIQEENLEPLNEISSNLLGRYISKASRNVANKSFAAGNNKKVADKRRREALANKVKQRVGGIGLATNKLIKRTPDGITQWKPPVRRTNEELNENWKYLQYSSSEEANKAREIHFQNCPGNACRRLGAGKLAYRGEFKGPKPIKVKKEVNEKVTFTLTNDPEKWLRNNKNAKIYEPDTKYGEITHDPNYKPKEKSKVNETLSPDATAADYIHDFVHSTNSRFAGKSKAERVKMALGAFYHKESLDEGYNKDKSKSTQSKSLAGSHEYYFGKKKDKEPDNDKDDKKKKEVKEGQVVPMTNHPSYKPHDPENLNIINAADLARLNFAKRMGYKLPKPKSVPDDRKPIDYRKHLKNPRSDEELGIKEKFESNLPWVKAMETNHHNEIDTALHHKVKSVKDKILIKHEKDRQWIKDHQVKEKLDPNTGDWEEEEAKKKIEKREAKKKAAQDRKAIRGNDPGDHEFR